ncbi:outer membrane protein assembly factor BamB family protein [Natronorubrum sp. FCH18a]|uniref:outer membrane protein assembly factor BamB family protein n=1 Tax=Natronorubrum sp. FCH18a TaxID=3447018 RepID=UPI003F510BF9
MSSAEDSSPQPTAHEVVPGCSLDRRTFLQGTAAAAAIAAGGVAASSTAAATDDPTNPDYYDQSFEEQNVAPDTVGFLFGKVFGSGDTNDEPNSDEIALYSALITAREWWNNAYATMLDNRLTDLQMAAHSNGRAAIADAWEDGASSSEANDYVFDAVENTFSVPYGNTLEVAGTVLEQISYVSEVAQASSEIDDRFVTHTILNSDYSGSGAIVEEETNITPGINTSDVTLPNGETKEVRSPVIYQEWDDGDSVSFQLDGDLLDSYSYTDELFNLTTQNDETADARGLFQSMAVPDEELESEAIFDLREVMEQLEEIEDQMQEVKGNYDLSLVDDIYAALDDGLIEPSDVRGVYGLTEHLSGSTDATSDRYRMALLNSLGLDRQDLSEVSSMTAEYDGFTDREMVRDSDTGELERVELLDEQTVELEGQLFGDLSGSLSPDSTYQCNPLMFTAELGGSIVCRQAMSGNTVWTQGETVSAGAIPINIDSKAYEDGELWYYVPEFEASEVVALDMDTGDELWRNDLAPDDVNGAYKSGSTLYVAASGSYSSFDVSENSVSQNWSSDSGSSDYVQVSESAGIGVASVDDTDFEVFDTETGDVLHTETRGSDSVYAIELFNDGESLIFHDQSGNYTRYDLSDPSSPSEDWSVDLNGYSDDIVYVPERNEIVATEDTGGPVIGLDAEDGSTTFSYDFGERIYSIDIAGQGRYVAIAGRLDEELHVYDLEENEVVAIEENTGDNARVVSSSIPEYDDVFRGTFFDAPSGDEYELVNGELQIQKLTTSDGEELEDDYEAEWDRPEYDEVDMEPFSEYLDEVSTKHADAVAAGEEDDDSDSEVSVGISNPFSDLGVDSGMLGLGLIGVVVLAVIGIVTDVIPGLGN